MYDTKEEAQQKLVNSVVIYDNKPVFVVGARGLKGKITLSYTPLPFTGDKVEEAAIEDPRWDFKNLGSRLGYVSLVKDNKGKWVSVYSSRIPMRASRQGLDTRTVQISNLNIHEFVCSWDYIYRTNDLIMTMANKFPSAREAFNTITNEREGIRSLAFSRKLLLSNDYITPPTLWYRNEKIGYTEDGIIFKLPNHKSFLKEELVDMEGLRIA